MLSPLRPLAAGYHRNARYDMSNSGRLKWVATPILSDRGTPRILQRAQSGYVSTLQEELEE
jgi:hypothetical protein